MGEWENDLPLAHSPIYPFALLTACATLILIVAGGLVTSNDAGDSVPDWPLAFGQVIPWRQLVGNVLYEYGHRVVGATVGLLTIILNILLWQREPRRWVRRIGLMALAAVIAQGTLGGIRVLLLEYRFPVAVVHACLAQIFFGLIVSLTVFTSPKWFEPNGRMGEWANGRMGEWEPDTPTLPHSHTPTLPHVHTFYLCAAATAAIFLQLILGAAFRHRGMGIVPHIVGAVVVTILLGWTVYKVWRMADGGWRIEKSKIQNPKSKIGSYLRRPAIVTAGLLLIQLILGISAYLVGLASVDDPQPLLPLVSLTVAHVAGGALTLAAAVVLMLRIYRVVAPAGVVMHRSARPQRALPSN